MPSGVFQIKDEISSFLISFFTFSSQSLMVFFSNSAIELPPYKNVGVINYPYP